MAGRMRLPLLLTSSPGPSVQQSTSTWIWLLNRSGAIYYYFLTLGCVRWQEILSGHCHGGRLNLQGSNLEKTSEMFYWDVILPPEADWLHFLETQPSVCDKMLPCPNCTNAAQRCSSPRPNKHTLRTLMESFTELEKGFQKETLNGELKSRALVRLWFL